MSTCCTQCFRDHILRQSIAARGKLGTCSYCGATQTHILPAQELGPLFVPLFKHYTPCAEYGTYIENFGGEMMWDVLNETWHIFSDRAVDFREELLRAICATQDGLSPYLEGPVIDSHELAGDQEDSTERLERSWNAFANEIKYKNRFFLAKTFPVSVLDRILQHLVATRMTKRTFYRARISRHEQVFGPRDMGKPPRAIAAEGRANPRGIPYLYVATNPHTAAAEVRPEDGNIIGIAKIRLAETARLVDLSKPGVDSPFRYETDLTNYLMILGFLERLGRELRKPIGPKESVCEYVPTQYLCEYIKSRGFDGVAYASQFSSGKNVAVFTDHAYKIESVKMSEVRRRADLLRLRKLK